MICHFNQRDISTTYLHLDKEFKSLKVTCKKCWKLKINFAALDERILDIERTNRTLQERFRAKYHMMKYKQILRTMIKYIAMQITSDMNIFPATNGASKHYSPHMIVNGKVLDFNKHLKYSFGEYGQASMVHKPTSNDNQPRTLDAIYLQPSNALQGGHKAMDLSTRVVVTRPKFTPCFMTRLVVNHVEQMPKAKE